MDSWDRFLCFDTETTGTDPREDRIVEIGAAQFEGRTIRRYRSLIHPERSIPPGSSNIHNIHDDDVKDAPTFAQVAEHVAARLWGGQDGPPQIVGYNILAFDLPLLHAELERARHPLRLEPAAVLDVLIFARWYQRGLRERKLTDLCRLYGVTLDHAHSAAADAQATGFLLRAMVAADLIPDAPAAALAAQATLLPALEEEWAQYSYWLYRDRLKADDLRMGCGRHCGQRLRDVDTGYLAFILDKNTELPAEVRRLFEARCGRPVAAGGAA